ncbi:hypothetical protein [Streptomyces hirsutus]|uniref:hypothetical protein n=1 Tax=Streptomyces hirsutus TaxID=35620 RepID=UPI0033B88AA6
MELGVRRAVLGEMVPSGLGDVQQRPVVPVVTEVVVLDQVGVLGEAPVDETKAAYAVQIAALDEAIRATRVPSFLAPRTRGGGGGTAAGDDTDAGSEAGEDEGPAPKKEKEDRNYVKAVCRCTPAAVIRVSPRTLARRNIMCGECMENFALEQSG